MSFCSRGLSWGGSRLVLWMSTRLELFWLAVVAFGLLDREGDDELLRAWLLLPLVCDEMAAGVHRSTVTRCLVNILAAAMGGKFDNEHGPNAKEVRWGGRRDLSCVCRLTGRMDLFGWPRGDLLSSREPFTRWRMRHCRIPVVRFETAVRYVRYISIAPAHRESIQRAWSCSHVQVQVQV